MFNREYMEYVKILLCDNDESFKKDTLYSQLKNQWIKYVSNSEEQI